MVFKIKEIFQKKITDRIKQFGWFVGLKQLCMIPFRIIYYKTEDIVLAKEVNEDIRYKGPVEVERLDWSVFKANEKKWRLPLEHVRWITSSLNAGSEGFMITKKDRLAAYGFVQREGEYRFGPKGKFKIPKGIAVIRNLFVFSEFRGQKVGVYINMARLASIQKGEVVIGFVIAGNRYAIRNLKSLGFKPLIYVVQRIFFKKIVFYKTKIIDNSFDFNIISQILSNLEVK